MRGSRTRYAGLRTPLSAIGCLTVMTLLTACGYQFRVEGAGPTIGGASATASQEPPPRLIIRTLINGSFEPNLETRYTNYLREEFSAGSGAQVVSDSEAADLVLSGQILSVIVPTLSFSSTATLESRTEVVVLARVEDARSRKVVWSQVVKGASEFFITPDLQFNRALQNRAVEQAGRIVAADLAARFLLQLEMGALTKQASAPASVSH
ncbi:MAG: LPS assembly lipoprotein LptE [Nitrospira sp.]|nr:LPS assembly lipoprotein LptE [Nitrospira sp.]MDH4251371.1 LPS assembly lipoprotein LptE [Nitrospira sp.]MDH4343398.1 LPS assembly lipoprotein LptE [Nitrospira sp.]MDH5335825.1 LPS assembly lipoprotein LptE [Nitrospira sp.]